MYIPRDKSGAIIIVGNSEEAESIKKEINAEDIIVRFNKPNPSCKLKADILFVANGPQMVARRQILFNGLLSPHAKIVWRYKWQDIILNRFEKIPLSRKLRYVLFFNFFKKINQFNRYDQVVLNSSIYEQCQQLTIDMPSSGFLAIYLYVTQYPNRDIYLHNFTYLGWSGHNWKREKEIINTWIKEKKIALI